MKTAFICSEYRPDEKHTVEDAVHSALLACEFAIRKGYAPIAPHLYIPRILDDYCLEDRTIGLTISKTLLSKCDVVIQWGKTITDGMREELEYARELEIPIEVYNTLGIPYEQWNSVRFKDDPDYVAACKEFGYEL